MQQVEGWWIPTPPEFQRSHKNPIKSQSKNDVNAIPHILKRVEKRDVCVQAGGRVGLWPVLLAPHFQRVYTFEPEEQNYECMMRNLEQAALSNVIVHRRAALGNLNGKAHIELSADTDGSHQVLAIPNERTQPVDMVTIDSLDLQALDLLYLDIEGFELFALTGGLATIKRFMPIIVCEQNSAMQRYGVDKSQIRKLLAPMGYRPVDRWYKDVIYSP